MEMPKFPPNATELDFEPIKEGWNEYILADGSIVGIRPIVFKVLKTDQMTLEDMPVIGFASSNVTRSRVPDELKLAGSHVGEVTGEEGKQTIEILKSKEIWNELQVEGGMTIRVKLIVSRIIRTAKYNSFGEPIYIVTSTNVVDIQESKDDS
jgi:hypothetical protein